MRNVFTTAGLARDKKRHYWEKSLNGVCGAFETCVEDWDEFFGHIDLRRVAGFEVAGHFMNPDRVVRSRDLIANSSDENFFFILQLSGRSRLCQHGNEALLSPGDMAIIDSGLPSVFEYDGPFRQCSLHLPRSVLKSKLGSRRVPYAQRISGEKGMGALTGGFLRSLYAEADHLNQEQSGAVRDALLDMIIAALAPSDVPHMPWSMQSARGAQLSSLKQFIEARLSDPELTPSSIADAYGISTRHLHRLFEAEDLSVGDWLRGRRLERARQDLTKPALLGHSVIQIAFSWGFNDASHFSRAFKAAFGISPRQYRLESVLMTSDHR